MAPTLRSMPAVRITRLCASGDDAHDLHLLQDQRQREGARRSGEPQSRPKTTTAAIRTISGTSAGVTCSACCNPAHEAAAVVSSKLGDVPVTAPCAARPFVVVGCGSSPLLPQRRSRAPAVAPAMDPHRAGPDRQGGQPQHSSSALFDRDRLDPVHGLVRHQRHAGVEEVLALGRFGQRAVGGELGDRLDPQTTPSAAGIAATWRRSRRRPRSARRGSRHRRRRSARRSRGRWRAAPRRRRPPRAR